MTVTRRFLGYDAPPLTLVVDYLVQRYRNDHSLDLSPVVLVLPPRVLQDPGLIREIRSLFKPLTLFILTQELEPCGKLGIRPLMPLLDSARVDNAFGQYNEARRYLPAG